MRPPMIQIGDGIRGQLVEHALRGLPLEACGLLAGTSTDGRARAERFYAMANADASPISYRLDPREQFAVFTEAEERGLDIVGIFHSHTHTDAYPSETDRRQAFYPDAHYLLVSLSDRNNPVLRAFTIRDGVVEEQDVEPA